MPIFIPALLNKQITIGKFRIPKAKKDRELLLLQHVKHKTVALELPRPRTSTFRFSSTF
jgi:hypothetical protein